MCDVCSNRTGVFIAANNLTEECELLSPIAPVEPLPRSSPAESEATTCTLAALHDQTQLQRGWPSLISPIFDESLSNGIEDTPGNSTEAPAHEEQFGALFEDPGSDPEPHFGRRSNQTPLFDPTSSQPEASCVIDLTMSSSPPEAIDLKQEAPSFPVAAATRTTVDTVTMPPPRAVARRPVPSILKALDVNGQPHPQPRAGPSRQLQTIDQLADEGVSGAVIIGDPRSPGHAKRKARERDRTFKDVAPLSGSDGPYSFYNSAAPRKRGRAENLTFKTPGLARYERALQNSPLTGVTTGARAMLYSTPPPAASPAPEPVTDRKSGMARLLAAATATFERGDLANEIFAAWKRKETGEQR